MQGMFAGGITKHDTKFFFLISSIGCYVGGLQVVVVTIPV
jgi:hypothetical protein